MADNKFFEHDLVSPEGSIVTARSPKEATHYGYMGYKPAAVSDIKRDEIRKVYDNWQGSVASFGSGILNGIPLMQTAITGITDALAGPAAAQNYATEQQTLTEIHPFVGGVGQMVGSMATAGAIGVGTGATTMAQVASGALGNAAMSTANHIDRASLAHAVQPGGEEKILAHIGTDVLFDALVGGALPVAAAGVTKLAKAGASLSEGLAESQLRKGLLDNQALTVITQQGRATELGAVIEQNQLWGLAPEQARAKIAPQLVELEQQYNAFKKEFTATMNSNQGGHLADSLGTQLGESHPELAAKLQTKMLEYAHSPSVGELQALRSVVDKEINWSWRTAEEYAAQEPLMNARSLIGRELRATIKANDVTGGVQAERWASLDRDYSVLKLAEGALRKAKETKEDMPWALKFAVGGLGFGAVGKAYSAYAGARGIQEAFATGAFAKPAKAMAGIFNGAAEKLTQATEAGLIGAAGEASAIMHDSATHPDNYDIKAAQIKHGMRDPQMAISRMSAAVQKNNLPDDMTQAAVLRAHAIHQYLYSQLPGNPDPSLGAKSPSTYRPSYEMRAKWTGVYNTLNDPSYGILNPTKENLDALKQFYPDTLQSVQEAVLHQVRNNTNMSLEGQVWATRIMGYPTGRLVSPAFYTALNQARQFNAQKAQQQQQGGQPNSGNQGNNSVQNMTKVQQLQNRGG